MTIIDKKVRTLGEKGIPMYFTTAQLKQATARYLQYTFALVNTQYAPPKGQRAYIIVKQLPPCANRTTATPDTPEATDESTE